MREVCAINIVLYLQRAQYEHMKHTSIRLTDEHAARIEATGKKPSIVVREALDAYFGIPPDDSGPLQRLIEEHERRCHSAQPAHTASTASEAQRAHNVTKSAHGEHNLSTEARTALAYILGELESGREPTSREAADKVGLTPTGLGMELSRHGIKAQNTRREMKSVKIYTRPMKARIEAILTAK